MVAQLLSVNNLLASVNPVMSSLHDGGNIPVMCQLLFYMYTSVHQHILQHSPVYVRVQCSSPMLPLIPYHIV